MRDVATPRTTLTPEQRTRICREGRIARVLDTTRRETNRRFARVEARTKQPGADRR
jgi:hypothetical protein